VRSAYTHTSNMQELCCICLTTRLVRKYVKIGICARCSKRQSALGKKRAEDIVHEFLTNDDVFPPAVHNRTDPLTRGLCCRRRVDFRMDYLYFQVIVEVDEHQHSSYGDSCEMVRLLDVVTASGGIPTLLFRLNPDNFRVCGRAQYMPLQDRLLLLKERIIRRTTQVMRRIRADTSRQARVLMPLLYIEYLFFNNDNRDNRYHLVNVRSFIDDTVLARAVERSGTYPDGMT